MLQVKFFSMDDGRSLAYFPQTQRFFFVDEEMKALISDMSVKSREEVLRVYQIREEEYDSYLSFMVRCKPRSQQPETDGQAVGAEKRLPRLVIHLANDCNLRCIYCYANGGSYRSTQDLMSREMLDRVLEVFFGEYHQIDMVQLFGGEPLMNLELVEYACDRIRRINAERGTKSKFGLVTNGTLIDDRFLGIVKEYGILVTVSYDGIPEINDRLRIFPDGSGTSQRVLKNIRKLRDAVGPGIGIETTYSRFHKEAGYSVLDVYDRVNEMFPGASIHVAPAGGDCSCSFALQTVEDFPKAIADVADRAVKTPGHPISCHATAQALFESLNEKDQPAQDYFCGAGTATLSVTTKGDIYPCFMLTDLEELRFGNVWDEDVFRTDRFRETLQKIIKFSYKYNHSECRDCFINTTCNACMGQFFLNTGKLFCLSSKDCERYRRQTEEAVKGLARVQEAETVRNDAVS